MTQDFTTGCIGNRPKRRTERTGAPGRLIGWMPAPLPARPAAGDAGHAA